MLLTTLDKPNPCCCLASLLKSHFPVQFTYCTQHGRGPLRVSLLGRTDTSSRALITPSEGSSCDKMATALDTGGKTPASGGQPEALTSVGSELSWLDESEGELEVEVAMEVQDDRDEEDAGATR